MPPISSIFSRGNLSRPVSSIGNISGTNKAVSSALGASTAKASSSVFHEAYSAQRGTTSIFHPAGQGQQGTTSITHVMNGDVVEQTSDDAMRDQVRDDLRYRHMRQVMREKADSGQTMDQQLFGSVGTGRGLGRRKFFMKGINKMVKAMPAKFKNLDMKDRQYITGKVRRYAKSLPIGSGFSLRMKNKMKKEVFLDKKSFKINRVDAKSYNTLIDDLPHK